MSSRGKLIIWFLSVVYFLMVTGIILFMIDRYKEEKKSIVYKAHGFLDEVGYSTLNFNEFLNRMNPVVISFFDTRSDFFNSSNGTIYADSCLLINLFTEYYFKKYSIKSALMSKRSDSHIPFPESHSLSLCYLMVYEIPQGIDNKPKVVILDSLKKQCIRIENSGNEALTSFTKKYTIMGYGYVCSYVLSISFAEAAIRNAVLTEVLYVFLFSIGGIFIISIFFVFTVKFIVEQNKLAEIRNDILLGIKHELKTPLATLAVSTRALEQHALAKGDDRIVYYAQAINRQQIRMHGIVQRIVDLDFIHAAELANNLAVHDIHMLLAKSISDFKLHFPSVHVSTAYHAQNRCALIDEGLFQIALYNFFENAVKYNLNVPEITVRTINVGHMLRISISDNGLGIGKKYYKRIFEKFVRIPEQSLQVEGIGLGLYIAKRIIKLFNGFLLVESEQGRGSVFHIKIPFINDDR